jgi:ABC-type Na+ efflux pump permease subunit
MYRTFVILRHTFLEAIVQPIYTLLLALGAAILIIFALLPYFTLGEDLNMFKSVGLDVILLFTLIATLFATSRSIYEEIEDRTMLTLMSKPLSRLEVMVGKYLGIISAALLMVAVLGVLIMLCTWWRLPSDYQLRTSTLDTAELQRIQNMRMMHLSGLVPSLIALWLQISVLAAIGVAISTRLALVVNLPIVILLYIAGNLTWSLFPITFTGDDTGTPLESRSIFVKAIAYLISLILPYLATFDLRGNALLRPIALSGTQFAENPSAVSLGALWGDLGVAALYAISYVTFALAIGMLSFRTRELGGGEG